MIDHILEYSHESIVDEHFGVASSFLIVDLETRDCELKGNQKLSPESSKCKIGVLTKEDQIDAMIIKYMGTGLEKISYHLI